MLVSNLSDQCFSANSSTRTVEWGHAYPFDLLGAWDFAVNDPSGVLGGKRPPSQVGLLGLSMGAFLTASAFGLEPQVPAVWVDSPPFQPKIVFSFGAINLRGFGVDGPQEEGVVSVAWDKVLEVASNRGVDLDKDPQEKTLPQGPDAQRPIQGIGNPCECVAPYA